VNELEPDLRVESDLEADRPVTPDEMKLIGDLLPQLVKDLLALQEEDEV
jgi:hypothetical protein